MKQLYLLINKFEMNLKTLAKHICGLRIILPPFPPSPYNNKELIKKLNMFSHQELNISLPMHSIPIYELGKKMTHYRYDAKFYQYIDSQIKKIDKLPSSID